MRLLYTSAWFRHVRDLVEVGGARWLLLSSLYGLVAPDAVIAPYDSNRARVLASGLWNQHHVDEIYDPAFLNTLETIIAEL